MTDLGRAKLPNDVHQDRRDEALRVPDQSRFHVEHWDFLARPLEEHGRVR